MKRLISISFISIVAVAAFGQLPARPENIPTDTMGPFRSDPMISSNLDSSQFSNEAYLADTGDYEWNQKGKKKSYRRTATSSSSKSSRRANASGKKIK